MTKPLGDLGVRRLEYSFNIILLHPVTLCNFDLGNIVPSGATNIYIEGPLLEGTFYAFSHRNKQRSHIQNHKERAIHTRNLRLKQSTALQEQQ
jgi:hypothetical protein